MIDFFVGSFSQYYGLDYAAMVLQILQMWRLSSKRRSGFLFGLLASFAWIVVNVIAGIWPGVLLGFVMIVINLRGLIQWKKD